VEHPSREAVLSGGCQCGAVRYALYAEPEGTSLCHCRMCQKAVGNVFAPYAPVRGTDFAWTRGTPTFYSSSSIAERGFCSHCGTPLSFLYLASEWTSVSVGSLDHPQRTPPLRHYGIESRVPWLRLCDGLPEERTGEGGDPASSWISGMVSYQHRDEG
jgi:hypothetical protein